MTKKDAVREFRSKILPAIKARYERDGIVDRPARSEAWNNYTDALCKDGVITPSQYSSWSNPFG